MHTTTRDRCLAILYAATIFVSAFLLFQVQPLVTKHILPWFGGSSTVWTVSMLFFQATLLAGYAYAHIIRTRLRPATQVATQLAVVMVAAIAVAVWSALPDDRWQPQDGGDPIFRILWTLAACVGLPFFVLATTAPLIQAWFARSFPGRTPYRLYALSNLGSLLALVSYPLVFERAFDLPQQARIWSWGFFAYAILCGTAAVWLWRTVPLGLEEVDVAGNSHSQAPSWRQRALWLVLPALATVALLATTSHICTDVAAVPLLWVVPLGLYLLTFIIAFDHPRWYRRTIVAALTFAAIYGAALVSRTGLGRVDLYELGVTGRLIRLAADQAATGITGVGLSPALPTAPPAIYVSFFAFMFLNLLAMFGFALLCHGELVNQRPHPRYLTSFYLMIAAGGVLGGAAVTLVAPQIFTTYFEWQLFMFAGSIWALSLVLHKLVQAAFPGEASPDAQNRIGMSALLLLGVMLVPTSLVLLDVVDYLQVRGDGILFRTRNFYGTLAVREKDSGDPDRSTMFLYHGVTAHGSQFTAPNRRGQPTTYYSSLSGIGRTLNYFRRHPELGNLRVGVVGLGTGTVAAYIGGGDSVKFYEIDPAVIDLAEGGRWFTCLRDARARGGTYEIKLGDARVSLDVELRDGQPQRFDVLVLDAFSGDSIPMHLLTEQAFDTYLRHIATSTSGGVDGALVVHVSNRYLDLEPVVRGAAEKFGIPLISVHSPKNAEQGIYEAEWIVLTRNADLLRTLAPHAATADADAKPAIRWTDQRSNLLDVVK